MPLGGDVNGDDKFAFSLHCDDAADDATSDYIETHCAFFVGHADNNGGARDGALAWGACPNDVASNSGPLHCTSTGFDRRFRPLRMQGDVDDNDDLGVAWICRDAADPDRAAALTATVEVFVGLADDDLGPPSGSPVFGRCPAAQNPGDGPVRCVSTGGDGRFHVLHLMGDVDGHDQLGLSLRARVAP